MDRNCNRIPKRTDTENAKNTAMRCYNLNTLNFTSLWQCNLRFETIFIHGTFLFITIATATQHHG